MSLPPFDPPASAPLPPPPGLRKPGAFPARDVAALVALLKERSGLVVDPEKVAALEVRLARFLEAKGMQTLASLVERMRARPYDPVNQECCNLFTIHETLFFRDPAPFRALRETILPEILRQRAQERTLAVWCAAASTGQEPYSVAMLLDDAFPQLSLWNVRILATDLSSEAIATARRGRYRYLEVNRGLPAPMLSKYFRQEGEEWLLDRRIADRVEFRQGNLLEPMLDLPPCDLVLMRNVLIYFDAETKRRAFERVRRTMRPDGFALFGASEIPQVVTEDFLPVTAGGAVFYRLREQHLRGPAPGTVAP